MNPEAFLYKYGQLKKLEREVVHLKRLNSAATLELEAMLFRAIVYMDEHPSVSARFLAKTTLTEENSLAEVAEAALEYLNKVEQVNLKEYQPFKK